MDYRIRCGRTFSTRHRRADTAGPTSCRPHTKLSRCAGPLEKLRPPLQTDHIRIRRGGARPSEGHLNSRRYLVIASVTDVVWDKYEPGVRFDEATIKDKRGIATIIMEAWCQAILAGTEDQFLIEHDFPRWQSTKKKSTPSAQAVLAVGPSNTAVPAGDAGDGVIDGMCVASAGNGCVPGVDEDQVDYDCSDDSDDSSSATDTSD